MKVEQGNIDTTEPKDDILQESQHQVPDPINDIQEFGQGESAPVYQEQQDDGYPDDLFLEEMRDYDRSPAEENHEEEEVRKNIFSQYKGVVENALSKYGEMRKKGAGSPATFAAETAASFVEDIYNTGVDAVNYVEQLLGGEQDVLENSSIIADNIPDDAVNTTTREVVKFLGGYLGIVNKVRKVHQAKTKIGAASQVVGSGMLTDFLLYKEDMDGLVMTMMSDVPFVGEYADYIMGIDKEAPMLEQRLLFSMQGILDGAAAEGLIKTFRFARQLHKAQKLVKEADQVAPAPRAEEPSTPRQEGDVPETPRQEGDVPEVTPREEAPVIDPEYMSAENIRQDGLPLTPDEARKVSLKNARGEGGVNDLLMYNESGERVYKNLRRLNTPDDIRRSINNIMEMDTAYFGKTKFTDDMLREAAASYNLTPQTLREMADTQGLNLGQVLAARQLEVEVVDSFNNASRRFMEGTIGKEELSLMYANAKTTMKTVSDMQSLSSAIFRENRIDAEMSSKFRRSKEYLEFMESMYGDNVEKIAAGLAATDFDRNALRKILGGRSPKKALEFLNQLRYNWLLADLSVHARNVGSSALMLVERPPATLLAATKNAIKKPLGMDVPAGSVTFGDAWHESLGMYHGFMEAMSVTANKARGVMSGQDLGQAAAFKGVRMGANKIPGIDYTTVSETGKLPTFGGFLKDHLLFGQVTRNSLQFEDQFIKHIGARMTLQKEGYRQAMREFEQGILPKEQVGRRLQEFIENPTEEMLDRAYRVGEEATFTRNVEGEISEMLYSFSKDNPIVNMFVPFARTNINVMGSTLERIPIARNFIGSYKNKINSVDPAIRQQAKAQGEFTTTMIAGLGVWLHSQDIITGTAPTKQGRWQMYEQAGYQPSSIRVGDKWVEYRPETPQGAILRLVADIAHLHDLADGENPEFVNDATAAAMVSVMELYKPEYLLDFVGSLFDAFGAEDSSTVDRLLRVGTGVAGSYSPWSGASRMIMRNYTEQGKFKREVYDPTSIMNDMWNQILNIYNPEQLAMKRNFIGHPIEHKIGLGEFIGSPLGTVEMSSSPVIQEMARLTSASDRVLPKNLVGDVSGQQVTDTPIRPFTMPSRIIQIPGAEGNLSSIRLRPAEYEKLVLYSAGIHPDIPKQNNLENTLKGVMKTRGYKQANDVVKAAMMRDVVEAFQQAGRDLYIGNDEVMGELRDFYNNYERYLREKYE